MAYPFGNTSRQSPITGALHAGVRRGLLRRRRRSSGLLPNFADGSMTRPSPQQGISFEPLEPRLLLSADIMPFHVDMSDPDTLFANAPMSRFPLIGQIIEPGRNFFQSINNYSFAFGRSFSISSNLPFQNGGHFLPGWNFLVNQFENIPSHLCLNRFTEFTDVLNTECTIFKIFGFISNSEPW